MIARLIVRLIKLLPAKSRAALINAVIHSWDFPIKAIISTDENRRVLVQGKPISPEQVVNLREGAVALHRNGTRRLIRDQIRFIAIDRGYLQNVKSDPYQELFYKAALWALQEEDELVQSLSGTQDSASL